MNVFDFRSGHSIKGVNAQALGEWLEKLRAAHGTLTARIVVEAAKDDPACPAHGAFEWDVDEAAMQHWLTQARRVIVSIKIVNSPIQTAAPAFLSVRTPDKGREYRPTTEVMSDEVLQSRALAEVRQFIEGLERRYAAFAAVAEALRGLKQKVG